MNRHTEQRKISRIGWVICCFSIVILLHYYYVKEPPAKPMRILYPDQFKLVEMNSRTPVFKLATSDGKQPYADGDRAQGTVVESLQLADRCRRDPSLIVVDVGAFLGDFGLYAAACGCQVYLFEVQPDMAAFIQTSIQLNNFSSSRVRLLQNAVSDLPANSHLTFSMQGGSTTVSNGTLIAKTMRLDDVPWPPQSTILMLKIDVEGFELNALRSAVTLFKQNRIHHLIFEYTAWWTDRAPQEELIPYVEKTLGAKKMYALDRLNSNVYGPLTREALDRFHHDHATRHLQTDIYATFVTSDNNPSLKAQPYVLHQSFA